MKTGIKCKACGDIIFSRSRHDYRHCLCGKSFVDGGDDYIRYGGECDTITAMEDDDFIFFYNDNTLYTFDELCTDPVYYLDKWLQFYLNEKHYKIEVTHV